MAFYDLSRLPDNGCFIFPLSIPRLCNGQQSEKVILGIQHILSRCQTLTHDLIFLDTLGLYMNTPEISFDKRNKHINQIANFKKSLLAEIKKSRLIAEKACHFMTWDAAVMQIDHFSELKAKLHGEYATNRRFRELVDCDLGNAHSKDTGTHFLFEELIVTSALRHGAVKIGQALSTPSAWRLVCYAGPYLASDCYLEQNKLLMFSEEYFDNRYNQALYNYQDRQFYDFLSMSKEVFSSI